MSPSFSLSGWTAEKNHPGKEKASRKILEAPTAIWCKHLVSRWPPDAKRRKVGKAESARNESLSGLQESLRRPPDGKDIDHRDAHCVTIPHQTLAVNDLVLLPQTALASERGAVRVGWAWSGIGPVSVAKAARHGVSLLR